MNIEPVMLIAEMTKFAVPVLVIVTAFALLLPTVALPKDKELGEIVAETVGPDPDPDPGADTPVLPHPVIIDTANRTAMAQAHANFMAIDLSGFVTVLC